MLVGISHLMGWGGSNNKLMHRAHNARFNPSFNKSELKSHRSAFPVQPTFIRQGDQFLSLISKMGTFT